MTTTEIKQVIQDAHIQIADIQKEADAKKQTVIQTVNDTLLPLGKQEFTSDTIFTDGVLEKYLPFLEWRNLGEQSPVRGLGEYVEQVLLEEVRKSTPEVTVDPMRNVLLFSNFPGLHDAYPFLQQFAPHVQQDKIVFAYSEENGRSAITFSVFKTEEGFCIRHRDDFSSNQNLTLIEVVNRFEPFIVKVLS